MKVTIDNHNKAVIANGWYKGHKIRAVAVCHSEDIFNADFGIELVTQKYKIKQDYIKMNIHESYIKKLIDLSKWIKNEVDSENKIIDNMDRKIQEKIQACEKFIK